MAEKTTEEMMAELQAAGYHYAGAENGKNGEVHVISCMECDFRVTTYERTVKYAYWHLEERRNADLMRRALEDIVQRAEYVLDQGVLKTSELQAIVKAAKEALAKN